MTRIAVLRNVLDGTILMELIPPNKLLTDMRAFLESKDLFLKNSTILCVGFRLFLGWLPK